MTTVFGCITRIATVGVICVALFAAALWLADGRKTGGPIPSTPVAVPLSALPASPTAAAEVQPAATAEAKLRAAEQTARTAPPGSHQPVSVTLSEAEVNALAVPQLEGDRNFPLRQPSIQILPGQFIVRGLAPVGPVTLPVTVTGTVAVQNGVPVLTVTGVQASGVQTPQNLVQQISDQLATNLRLTPASLPIMVQRVDLGAHTVTISGVTK